MAESDHIPVKEQSLNLGQIIDSSPALLHTARPDGYLDFFNQTWLDFAGEPLEKLLGWGWTSCIHPEDVDAFVEAMRNCFSKGKPFQKTSRVRRADGVYRWMLHLKVPVFDSARNLVKWNGSSIDIDDQKKAERQLIKSVRESQRSEFYLAEAQRLGHIGNWIFNPAKGFEYWSDELFRIHGLDPKQGPPDSEQYLAAVHPQDREYMASLMKERPSDDPGFDVTKRIVRSGGEVRYVRCVGAPGPGNDPSKQIGVGIDVTDHEILTQELRRREAYLSEAQRLTCTGSFGWQPGSDTIVWSAETYRIFEFDPATKLTLETMMSRVHPEDRTSVWDSTERASSKGDAIDITLRLLFSDGRIKHVRVLARPLEVDSDGIEFAGAVVDITATKRAEETLQKSERELRTLIDVMPAFVGTASPDGFCDFLSESWLDYLGITREQGLGWGWANTIHPEDVDRVVTNWRAGLAAGEPLEQELRCRRADGTYLWFLDRSFPLRDDKENIIKWYRVLTKIDALKKTEAALQMREHELLGIIDTIPSMLWSASPTAATTHLSQRYLDYCGANLEELASRGWERFIHPDDLAETVKAFARAIDSGQSYSAIHRLRRADGEYRWHHAMGEPLRDPAGKIIQWYGLTIDIDERKRAEDRLRDTRMKLAMASRLATVAELAGSIAHELNQPLTSVLANAQAAKRWMTTAPVNVEEVNSSIDKIVRDARAADQTMQHIRALFKQESFDKKEVSIPNILREVVRIVQEDPKKRDVPIECQFEEPLPLVFIDQIQIQQVFINLIVNAIEALERRRTNRLVALRAAADANEILIHVIDNGPGLGDLDRIFDAFVTTKANGMGIGLAVSRSIIEAHGGRLWAENNKAGGASFHVALPLPHSRPNMA
jgi:PAS domain S-box-containing protein